MDEKEYYFLNFQSQLLRAIAHCGYCIDFNPRNYALLSFLSVKHTLHYLAPYTSCLVTRVSYLIILASYIIHANQDLNFGCVYMVEHLCDRER